jgi:hypothetical protein
VDGYKLTREDAMVFLGGLLLFIGLLAFPWYSIGPFDAAATSSPYAIWGVFALIVVIVIVVDLGLERFAPTVQIPTTKYGRGMTRVAICALLLLFLFIKFIAHVGSFGWGFFIDLILAIVLSGGVWFIATGKATPLTMPSTGSGPR